MQGLIAIIAGGLVLGLAAGAAAEEKSRGALEYENSCQVCHGASGKGDGPFTEIMTVPIPDLTTIAHRNGGRFPVEDVLKIIDGRAEIPGHGFPMPVWGARYKAEAGQQEGRWEVGAELLARSRILELAFYLQTIQQ